MDIIVLPFKALIYETAEAAKHLSSCLKTLDLDPGSVVDRILILQPNRHLGLIGH